jgi:plastocyanin
MTYDSHCKTEDDDTTMNDRRRFLEAAGIALMTGLAGCSDGPEGGDTGDEDDTETDDGSGMDETETDDDSGTEMEGDTESSLSGATLVIDNVGTQAWEVVEDETGSVAPTGEENPTMTFEVGQRYAVENRGWSTHPFALRASDDTPLLSQSADGEFEGDADVDWVDNEETLSFTVTEDLAANLNYYVCTIHSSMEGDVEST